MEKENDRLYRVLHRGQVTDTQLRLSEAERFVRVQIEHGWDPDDLMIEDDPAWTVAPAGFYGCDCDEAHCLDLIKVRDEFRRHGYNVTLDAIAHNYEAWLNDEKSGWLDTVNGYFLFTACGCNPLRFYAEPLNGEDYQMTYTA